MEEILFTILSYWNVSKFVSSFQHFPGTFSYKMLIMKRITFNKLNNNNNCHHISPTVWPDCFQTTCSLCCLKAKGINLMHLMTYDSCLSCKCALFAELFTHYIEQFLVSIMSTDLNRLSFSFRLEQVLYPMVINWSFFVAVPYCCIVPWTLYLLLIT